MPLTILHCAYPYYPLITDVNKIFFLIYKLPREVLKRNSWASYALSKIVSYTSQDAIELERRPFKNPTKKDICQY